MSCRLTALFVSFLLLLLRVQSIDLTRTRSLTSPLDFDLPEVDGSAVDDICRIFSATPDPITTTTITTTTTTTTTKTTPSPITRKQLVTTTKKPAVQSPPRKPETKNTGTPIRKPPGPFTNNLNNHAASLLYHILVNSRRHGAGSFPGLNSFISRPIGGLPLGGDSTTSHSDELEAMLLKRAGRTRENRWKIGMFSSEDSSDES